MWQLLCAVGKVEEQKWIEITHRKKKKKQNSLEMEVLCYIISNITAESIIIKLQE